MSSRASLAAVAAVAGSLAAPWPIATHAIGGTFQLPVPLWLYLAGAAAAVAASFVVTTLMTRSAVTGPAYETRPVPMAALMVGYTVLSLWIIAAPIVVEPGIQPAALLR